MLSEVPKEFKRYLKHCHSLKKIIKDTTWALNEICTVLCVGCDEIGKDLTDDTLDKLHAKIEKLPNLLVFGQNCHAKALFVNNLLEQSIFPLFSSHWRHVSLKYGQSKSIHLTLGSEIEIVENLKALEKSWITIPEEDLKRGASENLFDHCPSLEVLLKHPLLKENVQILVPPDCLPDQLTELTERCKENILPVIIYAVSEETLNDMNIQEIRRLKNIFQIPFLFVSVSSSISKSNMDHAMTDLSIESLTESEKHLVESCSEQQSDIKLKILKDQLIRLGYVSGESNSQKPQNSVTKDLIRKKSFCLECSSENMLICDKKLNEDFVLFVKDILKSSILKLAANLSEIHNKILKKFILCAFDMAREIQITPRRISYAQEIELKLYKTLMKIACEQQEEITCIIQRTLQDMRSNVAEVLEGYNTNNSTTQLSPKVVTLEIQQLVLKRLSESVGSQIVKSVGCLQESFVGTLQRCLESLEKNCQELEGNLSASDAVKQIITAAYNIDIKTSTSFSVVHTFMDRLRKLLGTLALPWSPSTQVQCTLQWQLQVVTNMLDSLSAAKLAKTISVQFQEHIKSAHDAFQSAMKNLDNQLSGQLEHTEEQRIAIRKRHAPRFARLALESTSMCDLIRWGMPKQIKDIGRGQYGVVSSCEPWGGINPCAFKSVVPPDERHYNDLAMEFFYTRTIPEHPRIVKLRGSVIDHSYGGGSSPAVLLIMERMIRDLYCGLQNGLSWVARLRIGIDVIEGIRYLHSQGLMHRDIKLKNVLLDSEDRAKLTDFGFCIPEAMMSGSIVGTPVHMAPELLSGKYDANVDTYAFGILFWYLCSGQVKLPNHFDQFQNKEQLWNSVRKGIRPECLSLFDEACWNLMEQCWAAEPSERPLLGDVQAQVEAIYHTAQLAESNQGKLSYSPKSYQKRYLHNYRVLEKDDAYNNYNFLNFREY